MATYKDSMIGYADFHSAGRYFALAGAASALTGASLLYASNGHSLGHAHSAADLAFAAIGGWILLGLSLILAIAVLGSLLITHRARQTITVSELGVLSKAPRNELFLAREEILGVAEVPGNPVPRGAVLVTANSARKLLIPRWIGGYGACLEEIQALGIPTFPPYRWTPMQVLAGWLSRLAAFCGSVMVLVCIRSPIDRIPQWVGLGGLALVWIGAIFLARQRCSIRFDGAHERN
jgi:hypothetical protein